MKHYFYKSILIVTILFLTIHPARAQKTLENLISDSLTVIVNSYVTVGKVPVSKLSVDTKTSKITITANEKLGHMPFRVDNVKRIYNAIGQITKPKYNGFSIECIVDNQKIEELIPNFYRTNNNTDKSRQFKVNPTSHPLVVNLSRPHKPSNGLSNRHIALWQSHGWHYDQKTAAWRWQRARLFQTVEDLYTQAYVLPFIVPMLENAGAYVLLPRERDTQLNEVIVDNDNKDSESRYREHNDRKSWKALESGFAHTKETYLHGENPFTLGTSRMIQSITDEDETSRAEWIPYIPETGRYAVYVSYKSLKNSTSDSHYTVYHKGGKTEFKVNQTMNGGTWLYLGHFRFEKGKNTTGKVVLTNLSSAEGKIITADAVKFGGGMGNIARSPNENGFLPNQKSSDPIVQSTDTSAQASVRISPQISSYPRFTEGARYWLQWAGMPDSIYSRTQAQNDYTDDFQSRGFWVNYLIGGSTLAPNQNGLGVPVDLALAFHTDAGTTLTDSIVGTLGICTILNSEGKSVFKNGVSRWASRDLTDIIQTEIVNDIRKTHGSEWTRRGLWNRSYSESRVPEVPTMLLELLSHQNFADMRYGLDPRFRFTVSRSIYKGILKYLASANGFDYVVQPLPVEQFSTRFVDRNKLELRWTAVTDSLEPTAVASQFILYTRVDDGEFNNGVIINSNRTTITVQPGKIYSFKVTALNRGGESFPSEILSAYRASNDHPEVLIINRFDRLSAPASFVKNSTTAGFLNDTDAGVPYISDISFVGKQYEFFRKLPWISDDEPGFGASRSNFETKVIAGNSFDYPYIHGKAIKAAGFSFVSCSDESVLRGDVDMNRYKIVDLILGKQKQTFIGNSKKAAEFKTFPLALQQKIRTYCQNGGNLLVSGAYIGSDMYTGNHIISEDRLFVESVLKYKLLTTKTGTKSQIAVGNSVFRVFGKQNISFHNEPNSHSYHAESADAIESVYSKGNTICRYTEGNLSAGVAYSGTYKVCAFGFPFEIIRTEKERARLMESILTFFTTKQITSF
jgi:hypothetical protein